MRITFALFFLFASSLLHAQKQMRKNRDVFPAFGNYERKGWIINPALTYTFGSLKPSSARVLLADGDAYDIRFRSSGKIGVGFDVGRFYVTDRSPLISYVDFT